MFCTEHIIYLAVSIVLIALGIFFVKKFVKNEKTLKIIIKISAAFLLIWILINRFSVTYAQIKSAPDTHSWLNLIPYTFCGLASLVFSVSVLVGKKFEPVLHFIVYFGFFGGLASIIYPDFLENQTFWDIRSFSGLMHHTVMVWLALLLVFTRSFVPNIKKWYCYPIGFSLMMLLGLFEIDALGFGHAMNIDSPLISDLPVLTSWYSVFFVSTAGVLLIELIWYLAGRKRKTV